jgi:hypothetical protein
MKSGYGGVPEEPLFSQRSDEVTMSMDSWSIELAFKFAHSIQRIMKFVRVDSI